MAVHKIEPFNGQRSFSTDITFRTAHKKPKKVYDDTSILAKAPYDSADYFLLAAALAVFVDVGPLSSYTAISHFAQSTFLIRTNDSS